MQQQEEAGERIVRIGGGSGFWGDTPEGARQLIEAGGIDYLVMDYLAEVTMSILARARARDPEAGYATDFVTQVVRPYARQLAAGRIRVVVNAGGVHPRACAAAVRAELAAQGVDLKVAAVLGDDLMHLLPEWRGLDVREMFTGAPLPAALTSANAYLGGFPIAQALALGADIVVTGRCVDSALALGPLIHEFGWAPDQWDLLAAGSLAGHVIECGPQCTGGFATDWRETCERWADIGFPIAECRADGSFVVTKPAGTGGQVSVAAVAEQVTYETGDPASYVLPDVTCDWRHVRLEAVGADRVRVTGARGRPAGPAYKVSATHADGYRCMATLLVRGRSAADKASAVAQAILARTRAVCAREGRADFAEVSVERIGAEDAYGPHARTPAPREVLLKIDVRHDDARALDVFSREIFPTSTSTVQGVAGVFGGRPKVQPVVRLFSLLQPKAGVPVEVEMDGRLHPVPACVPDESAGEPAPWAAPDAASLDIPPPGGTVSVPLDTIAHGRSGDKGNDSNIAILARRPEFVPLLRSQLTAEAVGDYLRHLADGPVERFEWPGLDGFNFVVRNALGGGGVASLRYDPQGKAHAEILMDFPVQVPAQWAAGAAGEVR
ncbi:DUF1446 domain-containing protein [Verticiella sediminum]|uniref:DUF1446 domain-containing protein n=1 Tax=Verticiella sediminum TaxID=1247510 RepID=A0A556B0Z8_9BURK|nr:acyclic terpene utilization AtuA family protein [Verticiella sediminum]TSH98814.1 DUF1446 domain-containing protein [Verticiella sediminum]